MAILAVVLGLWGLPFPHGGIGPMVRSAGRRVPMPWAGLSAASEERSVTDALAQGKAAMAELRIAVEPERSGRPTQRVYLDGHAMSGVRRVRVHSERGHRTASLDLDLDGASIDPRAVSAIRAVCGEDNVSITIEADNVAGPVPAHLLPGWTRGPARAYRRPDAFDRARDCYARLAHVDWLVVIGVAYLAITVLGEVMEPALLDYANSLRQLADDE